MHTIFLHIFSQWWWNCASSSHDPPHLCIDTFFHVVSHVNGSLPYGIGTAEFQTRIFRSQRHSASLRCAMLISGAAYTHSKTMVSLHVKARARSFQWREKHTTPRTNQCLMETEEVSEKTSSARKYFFGTGCGERFHNKTLLARKHWNISASYISNYIFVSTSNDLRANFSCFFHVVSEMKVLHHTSTRRQYAFFPFLPVIPI